MALKVDCRVAAEESTPLAGNWLTNFQCLYRVIVKDRSIFILNQRFLLKRSLWCVVTITKYLQDEDRDWVTKIESLFINPSYRFTLSIGVVSSLQKDRCVFNTEITRILHWDSGVKALKFLTSM